MNTMIATREKPDLLFNNPLKQKVYVFLKVNPGKDFETFQVLTGDLTVSRQHFSEVEQAIKAREDRDRAKAALKEVNELFLNGITSDKKNPFANDESVNDTDEKDRTLKKSDKKKLNEKAKQYIKDHPDCTYDELVADLGFKELSKPHFFSMKTQLRKKGLIPGESRTRRSGKGPGRPPARQTVAPSQKPSTVKTIQILESIDATGFTEEIRDHYKSHVLPLLQRLVPGGGLHMVFLSDPPTIELRRIPR
jgi:hypothetical protein